MKKVPKPRHTLAVLVMALISLGYWYFAQNDDFLSDTQIRLATVAIKDQPQSEFYPHDMLFGAEGMWRANSPVFQAMLKFFLVPTNFEDVYFPYRSMLPVMVMVYLCGMYVLLYRQCLSWASALFMAVLSTTMIQTVGSYYWGLGALEMVTPGGFCISLTPLLIFAYLRNVEVKSDVHLPPLPMNWRLVLVFTAIGVLGNIDLSLSLNLAVVLAITYLFTHGFSKRSLGVVAACLLGTLIAASPQLGYYWAIKSALSQQNPDVSRAAIFESLKAAGFAPDYQSVIKQLLDWIIHSGLLLLMAVGVLIRIDRFRVRSLRFLTILIISSLSVSVLFYYAASIISELFFDGVVTMDFRMAAIFAMPAIYLLAGQSLTNLSRLGKKHTSMLRWACILLMCFIMLPSDNLKVPRHEFYELSTMFMDEDFIPHNIRDKRERKQKNTELLNISLWLRNTDNTPLGAVVICDSIELRLLSRRSIAVGDDLSWVAKFASAKLPMWIQLMQTQRKLLNPPAGKVDHDSLRKFSHDLSEMKYFRDTGQWYVVIDAEVAPEESAWLRYVKSEQWGKYLVLAKLQ